MRPYNPALSLSLSPYGGRHYNIAAHTGQQQPREGRNIDRELGGGGNSTEVGRIVVKQKDKFERQKKKKRLKTRVTRLSYNFSAV